MNATHRTAERGIIGRHILWFTGLAGFGTFWTRMGYGLMAMKSRWSGSQDAHALFLVGLPVVIATTQRRGALGIPAERCRVVAMTRVKAGARGDTLCTEC